MIVTYYWSVICRKRGSIKSPWAPDIAEPNCFKTRSDARAWIKKHKSGLFYQKPIKFVSTKKNFGGFNTEVVNVQNPMSAVSS